MDFAANESVDKLTTEDGGTVHLYAMWRVPDVIITFNSHGGTEVSQKDYTLKENENVPYGNLSESFKDGYTFMGWYTGENGTGRKVVTEEKEPLTETAYVSESLTLHAYWQKMPDITFKLRGGNIDDSTEDYVKVCNYGQAIGTIPTPSYGSQTFIGWFTEPSGGTEITAATIADGDATYYAHWGWQPKFETNGGSYTTYTDESGTHYSNPNYPLQESSSYNLGTLPGVERKNYTFEGWYIGDTDEKVDDNAVLDLSVKGNVFKAKWTRNPVSTVTLNPNKGELKSGTVNPIEVYNGQEIGELPTPTREGYDFDGWYDSSDTKYTYKSVISDNVTLTAKWISQPHTVTFDPTDGEMAGSTTYTIADNKAFTYLPGANCVETTGSTSVVKKTFDGWYTDLNDSSTKLTTSTKITGDVTYYAKWVDNRVTTDDYSSMIRWGTLSSADVTNVGDNLVFHPSGKGDVSAHLTVDLALVNQNNQLDAGSVRITLPKELFKGWDGSDVTTTKSTFTNFNVDTDENGNFVLTNATVFKSTVLEPVYTVDPMKVKGGYTDENGVYQDFYSKKFNIKIELKDSEGNFTTYQERELGVEFHTDVQTAVYKEQASASLNWDNSWGEKPSDAEEYFYVVWKLISNNYNSTQPYQISWSEDTVHDGSVVYAPDVNSWSNVYTQDSSNTIMVVTKHRRDEAMAQGTWAEVRNEAILNVKWKSGYEQQFRTTGKATAYVGEVTDGSIRSLSKFIPNHGSQDQHYIYGGQDLILNGDAGNLGELIYNIDYVENKNDDNPSWTSSGEMKITPRTYVLSDGIKGRDDVLISAVKPTDTVNRSKWDAADQVQLDDGDYYFTYLNINLTEFDSVYLNGGWSEPYENDNLTDYGSIKIYYRKMGSDSFETLKTIYHSDLSKISASGYDAYVELPADTVGYKVEYTSQRYTTKLNVTTGMKLKPTRKIHSLVSTHANAGKHTIIKNKSQMDITRVGSSDIVVESKKLDAWLSSYELTISESELYTSKSCLSEKNKSQAGYFVTDEIASTVEFPVAISGWAYSKNQLGYIKRVKSGVFHDLLPHGFTVDKSKIIVCARDEEHCNTLKKGMNSIESTGFATSYTDKFKFPGKISSSYYSVTFKENWENSGNTMMIIDINCPDDITATGFVVYYKCKTTINNLHINGTTPKNYIAFTDTTPEQSLPAKRIHTRDYFDSTTKPLFASLESSQTAYNYNTTTLNTPNVYQYGADSNVTTEGADISRHQVVGLNTDYSYNISYEGSTANQTHNLIIYDVIERQIGGAESAWQGKFRSIDVSSIKEQYSANESDGKCAPVVYYATKPKSEFTKEMFDLEAYKDTIWSTTPPENPEDVTAVAVDCRKTVSGKDFVLGVKKGVDLTINMLSPDDETRSEIDTFNEAVIKGDNTEAGFNINVNTRTSVTLRFTNPQFVKTAFPESGTKDKPESVVQGSVLDYILTVTNPDSELPMNNVVIEDKFPLDLVPNNDYTVSFNGGKSVSIDNTARVNYTISTGKNDKNEDVRVFTATVDTIDPGETVALVIPVKVGLVNGTKITNEAKITSINGVPYSNITSNKTYHEVTGVKAKILKVNSKGESLSGASLQIYENNSANWDSQNAKLNEGATPMTLSNDGTSYGTSFESGTDVSRFDVAPGSYILHEEAVPDGSGYKLADDILFTIDVEGIIHVNGEAVSHVTMVDEPAYKVVFHENNPEADDKNVVFKIYEPGDLNNDKSITHFYEIPEWAGDEYVFAGWYHNTGYTESTDGINTAANFENDKYPERDSDYHLYAKWIKVGTVKQDGEDANIHTGTYRGFGLAGVQIRDPQMHDSNYEEITPAGLRFVTSLSEELLSSIDALSSQTVSTDEGNVNVEYGYAVGTEDNISAFTGHYGIKDANKYQIQYKGENVNGKDTRGVDKETRTPETDYRYVTNVNCTKGTGKIKEDHRNFKDYRLYTLVVTYEGASAAKKSDKIAARSYIRYYDANGKLRVFYNTYKKSMYSGCLCSFDQAQTLAIPQKAEETETTNN